MSGSERGPDPHAAMKDSIEGIHCSYIDGSNVVCVPVFPVLRLQEPNAMNSTEHYMFLQAAEPGRCGSKCTAHLLRSHSLSGGPSAGGTCTASQVWYVLGTIQQFQFSCPNVVQVALLSFSHNIGMEIRPRVHEWWSWLFPRSVNPQTERRFS